MADKRIRDNITPTDTLNIDPVINEPKQETSNQYDSILQKIQELENKNKELEKKVAEASWDTSEKVKESKRKYWYEQDWTTRRLSEKFRYRYNCLIDDGKEKVVISTKTIWRPVNMRNDNSWKYTNIHDLEVVFHDWTKTKIDVLDYINQKFQYKEYVNDGDIVVKDGIKNYTFHTETFWTFTVAQNFIN